MEAQIDELMAATVRIQYGTGVLILNGAARVIVTARHVIRGAKPHRIFACWKQDTFALSVLAEDEEHNLAVLADDPRLAPGRGVRLAELEELSIHVGSELWIAGFPSGWRGEDPVVNHARMAGVGPEVWIASNLGQLGRRSRPNS